MIYTYYVNVKVQIILLTNNYFTKKTYTPYIQSNRNPIHLSTIKVWD